MNSVSESPKQIVLPGRYGRHHLWWLVGLLALSVLAVIVGDKFKQSLGQWLPETLPNPSTYNEKQSGYSGFYELAEKIHIPVKRWQKPYRMIDQDKVRGTLVMIAPWEMPTTGESDLLLRWLEDGNDLVLMDDLSMHSSRKLIGELGLSAHSFKIQHDLTAPVERVFPESAMVPDLKITSEARIDGGNPVASNKWGTLISELKVGKGRCLVASTPDMCANENLADPAYKGNFQFLINWLSTSHQPIYFDEKCHGYSSGNNVFFFLLRGPVGFVILQLLILLAVALWSLNQRFGPLVPVPVSRKISNLEFINGLATSYQKARARDTAWAMIYQPFKGRLCKLLGVAPHESPEQLAQAWAEASGQNRTKCEEFLRKAQAAMEKRHLDEKELVELVAACDELSAGSRELQAHGKILGA